MARDPFITGERLYKQLGEAWQIRGAMKNMVIHLEFGQAVTADVTHLVKASEGRALVETLWQYQLIPVEPWTWLAKALPDNAEAPLYVEWDPAALPPDNEEPVLYWTWDGLTVDLEYWYEDHWWGRGAVSQSFLQSTRIVLTWQLLVVPPAPTPRKDQA